MYIYFFKYCISLAEDELANSAEEISAIEICKTWIVCRLSFKMH